MADTYRQVQDYLSSGEITDIKVGGVASGDSLIKISAVTALLLGYEPAISVKNSAFNKNFGTSAGTVAEGDHTHSGLDAGTLDGFDSSQFLRSDVDDSASGNLTFSGQVRSRYPFPNNTGEPSNNLGDPTITEMALFQEQFNNKTAFYDVSGITFEETTDGTNWTPVAVDDVAKGKLVGGDATSNIIIGNGAVKYRINIVNNASYVFLNALYMYWSGNGHNTQVHIWKRLRGDQSWVQHTTSTKTVSSWPGHMYLPFTSIPFTTTNDTQYDAVRIEFTPNWNATYPANGITLYKMQIWGGYPAGKRNIYATDYSKNVTFPADLAATTFTENGTALSSKYASISHAHGIVDLSDVDIVTPLDGQVLTWDDLNQRWVAADTSTVAAIEDLTNVNAAIAPTDGQVLTWDNANGRWDAADATGGGTTAVNFTATADQTLFTVNYNPAAVAVFISGIKVSPSLYTASNGTTIVFGSGINQGTWVQVVTSDSAALSLSSFGVNASSTELNYMSGVTSNVQTQLNAKLDATSYSANDVLAKLLTVDGTGSGLDADKLGGLTVSSYAKIASPNTFTAPQRTSITAEDNAIDLNGNNNFELTATAANITATNIASAIGQSGVIIVHSAENITGWGTEFKFKYVPTDLNGDEVFAYFVEDASNIWIGRVQ